MRLGSHISEPFAINRGISQGSVLSPMLFNLVMDPLLTELRSRSLGISINCLFLGAFAHADDLRTMASNMEHASDQASFVHSFTKSRGLHLCLEKCAFLPSSRHFPSVTDAALYMTVHTSSHPTRHCVSTLWSPTLVLCLIRMFPQTTSPISSFQAHLTLRIL